MKNFDGNRVGAKDQLARFFTFNGIIWQGRYISAYLKKTFPHTFNRYNGTPTGLLPSVLASDCTDVPCLR